MSVELLKELPLPMRYALFPRICHSIMVKAMSQDAELIFSMALQGKKLYAKYGIDKIPDVCDDKILNQITDIDVICIIMYDLIKSMVETDIKDIKFAQDKPIDINTLGDKFFFKA